MSEPSNTDDVIDSRDVIEAIESLAAERGDLGEDEEALDAWDADHPEYEALCKLQDQAEGYCDWAHGATLIRDSYFKAYAQQYADDCGLLQDGASWLASCIDWDQVASELQMDYTAVEFDGITYWVAP